MEHFNVSLNEYQEMASRTINQALYDYELEMHALHGMVGEIGELNSMYQKAFQGHEFDEDHAMKELGDLLWFVAEYCTAMGWTLEDVAMTNIEKLVKRYPGGFKIEQSLNREEGDI